MNYPESMFYSIACLSLTAFLISFMLCAVRIFIIKLKVTNQIKIKVNDEKPKILFAKRTNSRPDRSSQATRP
jgi:hypothetical protein